MSARSHGLSSVYHTLKHTERQARDLTPQEINSTTLCGWCSNFAAQRTPRELEKKRRMPGPHPNQLNKKGGSGCPQKLSRALR